MDASPSNVATPEEDSLFWGVDVPDWVLGAPAVAPATVAPAGITKDTGRPPSPAKVEAMAAALSQVAAPPPLPVAPPPLPVAPPPPPADPPPRPADPDWATTDPNVGRPPSPAVLLAKIAAEEQAREAADPAYRDRRDREREQAAKLAAAKAKRDEEQAAREAAAAAKAERERWQLEAIQDGPQPTTAAEAQRLMEAAAALDQQAVVRHYAEQLRRLKQHEFDARHQQYCAASPAEQDALDASIPGAREIIHDLSAQYPTRDVLLGTGDARSVRQPIAHKRDQRAAKRGHRRPTPSSRSPKQHLVHTWVRIVTGSTPAAIILAYVRYWTEPRSAKDGTGGPKTRYADAEHYWVRGSYSELADVTGLTRAQVRTAVDWLLAAGLLIRRDSDSTVDPEPRDCLRRVAENMRDPEPKQTVQGLTLGREYQYYRLCPAAIWERFRDWVQIEADGGALPSSTPAEADRMYAALCGDAKHGEQYEVEAGGWYRSPAQAFFQQAAVQVQTGAGHWVHAVLLSEEWVVMRPGMVRSERRTPDETLLLLHLLAREQARRNRKRLRFDLSRFTLAELATITGIRAELDAQDRTRHAKLQRLLSSLAAKKYISKNTITQPRDPKYRLESGWRSLLSVSIHPDAAALAERGGLLDKPLTEAEAIAAEATYRESHAEEDRLRTVRGSRSGDRRPSRLGKVSQSEAGPADGRRIDPRTGEYHHYDPVYLPTTGRVRNVIETDKYVLSKRQR